MAKKRILLMAGAGTLGGYATIDLLENGWTVDVICLNDFTSYNKNLRYIKANVTDELLRGLFGGALLAATRVPSPVGAARNRSGPGEPCRHDNQCRVTDPPLICAWNGFGHDGDFNCCSHEGRCSDDAGCCGYNVCVNGFCADQGRGASAGSGG